MKFSEEEKAMWLEDWRGSGGSAWAYAKANGLNPQTFIKWTKAGTAGETHGAKPCFVELPAVITPPPQQAREILVEKGDVRIRIPADLGRGELRAIMEGLGGVI
jgi:transposase-like protein